MGAISSQNSSILGLEMFSFQAVVTLVILFILKWRLQSMSMSLFSMPLEHVPVVSSLVSPLNIILVSVFASFGTGYLEAAILTGITIAFKGKTSIHRMVCAVGYKAMIQGLFLALAGILSLVSLKLALYLLVIGFMAAYLFFIDGYRNAVEIDRDRRLYAFLVGQILVTIAMMIILNFVVTSVITSAVGSALGELGNGLGGYGSGGLFQNLY